MAWSKSHLNASKILGADPFAIKKTQLMSLVAFGAICLKHPDDNPLAILAIVIDDLQKDLNENGDKPEGLSQPVL